MSWFLAVFLCIFTTGKKRQTLLCTFSYTFSFLIISTALPAFYAEKGRFYHRKSRRWNPEKSLACPRYVCFWKCWLFNDCRIHQISSLCWLWAWTNRMAWYHRQDKVLHCTWTSWTQTITSIICGCTEVWHLYLHDYCITPILFS